MTIKVNVVGMLTLERQMQVLAMGSKQRRRLLYKVAKAVRKNTVQRTRKQVDLRGRPFKEHHNKRRRKMLTRLVKQKNLSVVATGIDATIKFKNPYHGGIAAKQQRGYKQIVRSSEMKPKNKQFYDQPATRKQAKALIEAGFRIKKASGKGKKKPSIRYITEHFTVGKAGHALKKMRLWSGNASKKSWVTTLPARSFLGATPHEVAQHINRIFDTVKQELHRVSR